MLLNEAIDKSGNTLTTRYGDPEVIANDMEKVIYGSYFYIKKLSHCPYMGTKRVIDCF